MISSYRLYSQFVNKDYLSNTNEDLVKMYKSTAIDSERSQIVSALFVKNFTLALGIANKFPHVDSAEKASLVMEELLKAITNFDFNYKYKFITYFINCLDNRFIWDYSKNKESILIHMDAISTEETIEGDPEGEFKVQLEDKFVEMDNRTREFYSEIDTMFEQEFNKCVDEDYKSKLMLAKRMIEVLKEDESLVNDQVARILGLFVDKQTKAQKAAGEHNYIYDYSAKYPDYKRVRIVDSKGNTIRYEVQEEHVVKRAQWGKVAELRKFLASLFVKYGICPAKVN